MKLPKPNLTPSFVSLYVEKACMLDWRRDGEMSYLVETSWVNGGIFLLYYLMNMDYFHFEGMINFVPSTCSLGILFCCTTNLQISYSSLCSLLGSVVWFQSLNRTVLDFTPIRLLLIPPKYQMISFTAFTFTHVDSLILNTCETPGIWNIHNQQSMS